MSKPLVRTLLAFLLLVAPALTGCSGMMSSDKPVRQTYLLQPWSGAQSSVSGATTLQLAVTVTAVPGLDTDRILGLAPDARLIPYANARWSDNLPEVMSSITRRTLESTGRFASVSDGPTGAKGEWRMELEIQTFYGMQSADGNTSSVKTHMQGHLRCGGGDVHPLRVSGTSSVNQQALSSIVRAHQSGVDQMMKQLLGAVEDGCGQAE